MILNKKITKIKLIIKGKKKTLFLITIQTVPIFKMMIKKNKIINKAKR